MKTYIGTKIINAEPQLKNYGPPETHGQPGYKVVYPDGYTSWSPAAAFEEAYRETSGMPFGLAIEALKKGLRAARAGWNGKGVWLGIHTENGVFVREECGSQLEYLDYIVMKTADGKLTPWQPSQADMLTDDWQIVE